MSSSSLESSSAAAEGGGKDASPLVDLQSQGPIRAELLGLERLGERARTLARRCELAPRQRVSSPLLCRFMDNRRVLIHARRAIIGGGRQEIHGIDADWLADNFHIIDEVLREVRQDLPRGYDIVLPKLGSPPLAGYPRVYALAWALVAHTDSELDEPRIIRFVQAFQDVVPLTIGELWAIPTMCRVVLIENLRRLAEQMLWGWNERLRAERWWREVWDRREAAGRAPQESRSEDRLPSLGELSDPFVVRLVQLLRDEGETALAAVDQLDRELVRCAKDPDEILARESHRQASNQVTIGNCVLSLRLLSTVDWNSFFERSSLVQQILRDDPAGAYPLQDFTTSDRCRKAVEKIARGSHAEETDVARRAIDLARAGASQSRAKGHVGYYLLGQGECALQASFGYRAGSGERLLEAVLAHPKTVYFGSLGLLLGLLLLLVSERGLGGPEPVGWFGLSLILLAAILPLSELAVGLVNHLLTLFLPPRVLPKLEFKEGIPEEFSTFVVMPSMLVRPRSAEVLCERLETHYLANPTPRVRFALLTDFADAPQEEMPDDRTLIEDALLQVRELNRRYANDGPELFYLFHRRRLWNPAQGCWMGWERKRGKLSEFNRLLRGETNTTYAFWSTDPAALPRTRFVITLDADTQMPRDTVGRLIGTLAHPLNQPRFDEQAGRVVEGYGVLQPRVSFHLTAATHSHFAALLAASGGIDPYSTAASDAYMDLFGLGSFTGKGIYDVEAFELATGHVFPENHILSHDLIEGNYARCGLLSDTELFDDFPARYLAYARREHRWVRGDWQLLPWLGRRVPAPEGARPNPLPALERWKLFDNLRRSLVPPALIAMLALGWTVLPGSPWFWTAIALAVLALPLLKWLIGAVMACVRTRSLVGLTSWRESIPAMGGQALLSIVFLADQTRLSCDAIARTLWRLLLTRRKLLEWETAAAAEQRLGSGLKDFATGMWGSSALALAVAAAVGALRPDALWAAGSFLAAWFLSPAVAFWVSRARPRAEFTLTEDDQCALRRIARKTWHFFETFVGNEGHWLPPDNYQVDPDGRVAHRTSPTNQGLLLLSTLAANDLGYISLGNLAERLERTFDSLERMEKHWGHFFNWYDTRTLQPLPPAYISTVDSGNFLACLVALKQGLKEKLREPVLGPSVTAGLADTLRLIDETHRVPTRRLQTLLQERPDSLSAWGDWLERMEREAETLVRVLGGAAPRNADAGDESRRWADALLSQVRDRRTEIAELAPSLSVSPASRMRDRLLALIHRAETLGVAMDFRPLYKSDRHLYAIGANLSQGQLDGACYDLLASESCLTSYLTVARGDAPRRHWFQLGRPYIHAAGRTGLISWGGTMFEYLMPRLLLRSLPGTLLAEACNTAVARQMEYGRLLGIPWGISESAFNDRFLDGDYRYQAFGVPGLGLKRGLENDQVVAPYATALATMIAPREALANLRRLASEGAEGPFGFYEAIDYTPQRLSQDGRPAVVRSYMAHHQGMSLLALTNVLLDDLMPRRFHGEPTVRAADLLLQERMPPDPPIAEAAAADLDRSRPAAVSTGALLSRRLTSPFTVAPRTHLLSNTRYHVMITNGGSGFSKCQDLDVTRWRHDSTCEHWGQFVYVRDLKTGAVWSAGHQPVCRAADHYEVVFSTDKASIRRRDGDVETQMEVTVSPEHPAEVRRVTLTNQGNQPRELEVTSYLEPVLCGHASDLAHPAFGKLFLETERPGGSDALLCRRRPRSAGERPIWGVHVMAVDRSAPGSSPVGDLQYETDRARFVGRGRSVADPAALDQNASLSGTVGPVIDPVLSLRRRFRITPGGSVVLGYTLAVVESRDAACALADQYQGMSAVVRAFELAWAHSQVRHGHQDKSADDVHLHQRLGAHLLFAGSPLGGRSHVLSTDRPAPAILRELGISGELAIILARIAEPAELSLVRQLLAAHDFLRVRGLETELVLFSEERSEQDEDLNQRILELVCQAGGGERPGRPGGVHLVGRERITEDQVAVLKAAAWVVLDGSRGTLAGQLDRIEWVRPLPGPARWPDSPSEWNDEPVRLPDELLFHNGLGGFTADGREYALVIGPHGPEGDRLDGQPGRAASRHPCLPPAPWINVVANPVFGFLVSESGAGFTWAGNSQTNRLTCWSNDPVVDPAGEVVYLRDELTGQVWCPTPLPVPSLAPTLVRHGQGSTIFQRNTHGIAHELTLLVPHQDPIKLIRLRLRNTGSRTRSLSATFFAEWVLGATRDRSAAHVVTELDPDTGALLARNPFREDFGQRVAFADVNRRPRTVTADRVEFLGRHGSTAGPAALERVALCGRTGAGIDPCAALQVCFSLEPRESTEIVFVLGEADNLESAHALIRKYWEPSQTDEALQDASRQWDRVLGTVQVHTPDPAFDLLMNRWLLYQVISCRLRARSAFYQSGGAYGFRDQLQDVMALVHAAPDLAREQILRAASRQFVEGDVQHWWHPPVGRGVRTRIADDLLWLPYATAHYVSTAGDPAIVDEVVSYLASPELLPGHDDALGVPAVSEQSGSLYDHCTRALDRGIQLGIHGLPLMGSGDWNDGMNRVGAEGRGESVWLAWFLADCLRRFAGIAASRGDVARSVRYRQQADALGSAVETHAWDGAWYLRAFFDDGTPLGSARADECQIDSIAQSWSVISASADPERSRKAMQSVVDRLVRKEDGLILLLTPPFDDGPLAPGYIKGYLPGVRENGAQYTHAAAWVVQAIAMLGQGGLAYDLFQSLNPIHHASDWNGVHCYKVEPYVVAGDVYSLPPHVGRGGWTWYTGAAGWLYRVGLESILGIHRAGDSLRLDPCLPPGWSSFEIAYRFRSTMYNIAVENPLGLERGVSRVLLDGQPCERATVPLVDDRQAHQVRVLLGNA